MKNLRSATPLVMTLPESFDRKGDIVEMVQNIDSWELFDLEKDPHELDNVYGKPGYEKVTADMMKEMNMLQKKYNDPIVSILSEKQ